MGDSENNEVCNMDSNTCEDGPPPQVDEETGMECSMDGYVALVQKLMTVALSGLSILKQIGSAFLPDDLRKAVDYGFRGLLGMGDWIGYAISAAYYLSAEFNYGEMFCKIMGY